MSGILHLYSAQCDFQARRSFELLKANLHGAIPMAAMAVGPGGNFANLPAAILGLRATGKLKTHIAHAWGPVELMAAAASGFSKIIFSPQAPLENKWFPWVGRVLSRRRVEIVCPTQAMRQVFVKRGAPAGRCHVISPGVDPSRPNGHHLELRAELGLAESDIILLAPGESTREASHQHSVWSAGILNVLDHRYRLLTWGRGPLVDSLERFAQSTRQDHLLVQAEKRLGKEISFEEVASAADIAIFSAHGLVPTLPLLICLAAGLPVAAAATATSSEILRNNVTAMMEPRATPRTLAQCVLDLQKNATLRRILAQMARAEVVDRFSIGRFVAGWRTVYSNLDTTDHARGEAHALVC